ncbi:MAG: choice-of-anchor Q domain-containing protein [Planctomycetota bacterium]
MAQCRPPTLSSATPPGATVNGANNILNLDPRLAPLADNGGPTPTHIPMSGSPVRDSGEIGISGAPPFDQRGPSIVRIFGPRIDRGAVEVQDATAPQIVDVIISGSGWANGSDGGPSFVDAVDGGGPGAGNELGYSLVGAHQLDTIPWFGADTLYVQFSEDVSASIGAGDVALTGTNGGAYSLGTLQYDVAGLNVLTIPVTGGIDADAFVGPPDLGEVFERLGTGLPAAPTPAALMTTAANLSAQHVDQLMFELGRQDARTSRPQIKPLLRNDFAPSVRPEFGPTPSDLQDAHVKALR